MNNTDFKPMFFEMKRFGEISIEQIKRLTDHELAELIKYTAEENFERLKYKLTHNLHYIVLNNEVNINEELERLKKEDISFRATEDITIKNGSQPCKVTDTVKQPLSVRITEKTIKVY